MYVYVLQTLFWCSFQACGPFMLPPRLSTDKTTLVCLLGRGSVTKALSYQAGGPEFKYSE